MKYIISFAFACVSGFGMAWTPFAVDVSQETFPNHVRGISHLEPVDYRVPESYYIAQYIAKSSFAPNRHLQVYRKADTGKFFLKTWDAEDGAPSGEKLHPPAEVQISEKTASLIYQIWCNALLETHYSRVDYKGLDGATYIFSTYVRGLGWLHGKTWSPALDLPPLWMVEAGDRLLEFPYKEPKDPKKLEADLVKFRDRLFAYLKANGKH